MTNKTIYGAKPFQSSIDNRYHYVYRITNLVEGKHYYGSRTSSKSPELDIATKYFGSPSSEKNRWIIDDQKVNPSHYEYKILKCFGTRKEAIAFEVFLHKKFNVKRHRLFYNEANQTSSGFDSVGKTNNKGFALYKSSNGEIIRTQNSDDRVKTGELVHMNTGKVHVKDKVGNSYQVDVSDERITTGELLPTRTGYTIAKNEDGSYFAVSIEEFKSKNYKGVTHGKTVAMNSSGETFHVDITDDRFKTGELVGVMKNTVTVKDRSGNALRVHKDDPRIISGELTGTTKGKIYVHNGIDKPKLLEKDEAQVYINRNGYKLGRGPKSMW